MANNIMWLDTEYCGRADETIQLVLVDGVLFYTLFDRHGYQKVFKSFYSLYKHLNGEASTPDFESEDEVEMINYLENL